MPETLTAGDARESRLARVADEFLAEVRRGRPPSVEEVAGRHPDLADELRKLLPALVLLGASGGEDSAGLGDESGVLGDFRIVREVGRGGMGVVYEAEQI